MNSLENFIVKDLSPLRYPGSKQRLVEDLDRILSFNYISPELLVEPFVGGGSVFLYFLVQRLIKRAIIGDADRLVSSFWKTLFSQPQQLIDFVESVDINLDTFKKFKEIAENESCFDQQNLARACLFLNRTSFSGILAPNAGPIGGKSQASKYTIDCRFNRRSLVERINYISTFAPLVTVLDTSWENTMSYAVEFSDLNNSKTFFYLDPPFFYKAEKLYRTFFTEDDHRKLYQFLVEFPSLCWILSYDNAEDIRMMYTNEAHNHIHVEIPYSVSSRMKRTGKELLITRLRLPPAK